MRNDQNLSNTSCFSTPSNQIAFDEPRFGMLSTFVVVVAIVGAAVIVEIAQD